MTWPKWEFKFNLTTLTVLGGFFVSLVLWYSVVSAHLDNKGIHTQETPQERHAVVRDEVSLQVDPLRAAVVDMRSGVTEMQNTVRALERATIRVEETLRLQHERRKEDEYRNWLSRDSRGGPNERP